MRAAVTGATGHLGAALVRRLLEEGARVRAVVRDDTRALAGLDVETVRGDLSDPEGLARAFAGSEVVFHLAGRISIAGDPDGSVARTNVLGTRNVVGPRMVRRHDQYDLVLEELLVTELGMARHCRDHGPATAR